MRTMLIVTFIVLSCLLAACSSNQHQPTAISGVNIEEPYNQVAQDSIILDVYYINLNPKYPIEEIDREVIIVPVSLPLSEKNNDIYSCEECQDELANFEVSLDALLKNKQIGVNQERCNLFGATVTSIDRTYIKYKTYDYWYDRWNKHWTTNVFYWCEEKPVVRVGE